MSREDLSEEENPSVCWNVRWHVLAAACEAFDKAAAALRRGSCEELRWWAMNSLAAIAPESRQSISAKASSTPACGPKTSRRPPTVARPRCWASSRRLKAAASTPASALTSVIIAATKSE